MTPTLLLCPRCNKGSFAASLEGTYIVLRCQVCHMSTPTMMFVVDLTPEIEHEIENHSL
jgi:hypothetical protein